MSYSQISPQLSNIMIKTRRYSSSPSVQQVTDQEIVDAINTYYMWDLPSNLKLLNLQFTKTLFTEPNVDVYDFDSVNYFDIQPPVYIAGYQMQYVQSKNDFYGIWPKLKQKVTVATGDGATQSFTFSITGVPMLRSHIYPTSAGINEYEVYITSQDVNGDSMVIVDQPNSPTTGDLYTLNTTTGVITIIPLTSINYITGICTAIFPSAPGLDVDIEVQNTPFTASRSQTIWFFQNQLTLRPVPDDVYQVTMNVIMKPTALLANADIPHIEQWWQLLALGAARIILQERLNSDQLAIIEPFYREQLSEVENRTLTQLGSQRGATLFSSPYSYPFGIYNPLQGGV